ncbi:MAG: hypothetical protein Q9168_007342 [Polycauliona sp. 1 TL-2023]
MVLMAGVSSIGRPTEPVHMPILSSANPGRGRSQEEQNELKSKYKPGEPVLPRVRVQEVDAADERMLAEVREMSLRDAGVRPPASYERGTRHRTGMVTEQARRTALPEPRRITPQHTPEITWTTTMGDHQQMQDNASLRPIHQFQGLVFSKLIQLLAVISGERPTPTTVDKIHLSRKKPRARQMRDLILLHPRLVAQRFIPSPSSNATVVTEKTYSMTSTGTVRYVMRASIIYAHFATVLDEDAFIGMASDMQRYKDTSETSEIHPSRKIQHLLIILSAIDTGAQTQE